MEGIGKYLLNSISNHEVEVATLDFFKKNLEIGWYRSISFLQRLMNKNDTALQYLNILIEKNLASARDWQAVGCIYEKKKVWDKAAHALTQAVERSARNPQYLFHLGLVEEKAGNVQNAENMYNEALQQNHSLIGAVAAKGQLLYKKGIYKEAVECFKKCLEHRKKDASIENNLGMCYLHLNEFKEALNCFKTAAEYQPSDREILFNLATVNIKLGEYRLAIEILNSIKDPCNFAVVMALGYCFGNIGEYKESLEYYHKALTMSGDNREILINISSIYAKSGESKRALNILHKLLSVNPYDIELLNNIAWVYEQQNEYGDAEMLYYRGLAISTGNPCLAYNLICCLKRQRKYFEALDLVGYLKRVPEWQNMGWSVLAQIYEHLGADKQAAACYNKALGLE